MLTENNKNSNLIKRIILYVFGQFILAFGISLSIKTNLGVSPVSSVPLAFSNALNVELGNMTIIVHFIYVIFQYLLIKEDFKLQSFLQLVVAILFGKCVTVTNLILKSFSINTMFGRYGFLLVSIVLIAVGLKLYMWADICPQATDGLVNTIAKKWELGFSNAKNIFDLSSVLLSVIVSQLFLNEIVGIREGTVIAAILVGRIAALLQHTFASRINKILS